MTSLGNGRLPRQIGTVGDHQGCWEAYWRLLEPIGLSWVPRLRSCGPLETLQAQNDHTRVGHGLVQPSFEAKFGVVTQRLDMHVAQ